ncbi:MAG: PQQ-binding-like beta-propeller repeat protein [Prolixibacteraceae bacterium]|jgi:outer membrane protein assembly factor BamB|nr:PQQ-binding-like beta-propeller repeat protein [Prolixibacteraceae bacterium]MBT6764579.1 PQQ-binding-like beta-propeller repeat protein [Prolixibacteraceae bacterium]MBT6998653.1 PQQ-binding-like beta-propeller repeat protein [Prolixibacteraceae bacterium]MBT7397454.1 PQQ-binding-like beta-propeller repeat protein [Prolixibacteraceae bacterium]
MINLKSSLLSGKKLLLLTFVLTILTACNTNNWPNFRGPDTNQLTSEKTLPLEWSNDLNLNWKYDLVGRGWSSPIVWGNKVFFTNAVLEDPSILPPAREGRRQDNPFDAVYNFEVICLDLDSGEEIWKNIAYNGKPRYKTHRDNTYAPESMVTDGKNVYAYFGMHGIFCYDMKGNLVWEKDLGNYPMQSNWGTSSSPLLYKKVLYMQIDNEDNSFLAALDSKTGDEIWRIDRDEKSNWGTPVIWENSVRKELVVQGKKARSYNPENGELLWELDLGGGRNIASPTWGYDMIFMGNETRRDGGGFLFGVKAGAAGDISLSEGQVSNDWVAWSVPKSGIAIASPLFYEGLVYIVDRNRGQIFCYEATTGEVVYPGTKIKDAKDFWASPWAFDGKIYCLDDRGTTHVIQAGKTFMELGKNKLNDVFWASTAIAKGSYIFRGEKAIYCIR